MVRRRRQDEEVTADEDGQESSSLADMNEVVAYNFKRARDLYGWTQDEVADRLEPFLGVRLPQASISGIERGYMGRRREFDAQELVAFAVLLRPSDRLVLHPAARRPPPASQHE